MPKMRGIKPEIWTDEKFVELSPHARLLFVGMWHYACDNGHLEDRPKQLKMRVLPVDAVDAGALVEEMIDLGMVTRSPDGLTIPRLRDHQRLDNRYFTWCDRCALAEIPEPARSKHPDAQRAHDGDTTGTRSANTEAQVKEGRKEGEGEGDRNDSPRTTGARRKPAKHLPDDWLPNDEHRKRCSEQGIDLDRQVAKFRAHAEANDRKQANWNAAFTQWLLNVPSREQGLRLVAQAPFPANGTREEQDAWVRAQPRQEWAGYR